MAEMNVLTTLDVAAELGVPEWRLNEAVRRGEVTPTLLSGRRLWTDADVRAARQALIARGVLDASETSPTAPR